MSGSHLGRSRCWGGGGCPAEAFCKEWDPQFFEERNFNEDRSHVERTRKLLQTKPEGITPFFEESEVPVPSCVIKEVSWFCKDADVNDLRSGASDGCPVKERASAWLDDRSRHHLENCECLRNCQYPENSGCVRRYENPLSASALCRLLQNKRFGVPGMPDANRRLIYIADPNPYHILALIKTAPYHQVSALRSAIWGHLALQTSVRVKINPRGFKIFHLEFQMPYFALRKLPHPKENARKVAAGKLPRKWIDLSFLQMQSPQFGDEQKPGIFDAQITLVICGSDDSRWVAYALDDTCFGDDDDEKEEGAEDDGSDEEEDKDDLEEGLDPYIAFQGDPIASRGRLDSNKPLWNPREYFLTICNMRMAQIRNEWQDLVRELERNIAGQDNQYSPKLSGQSGCNGQAENIHEVLYRTVQSIEVLNRLQNRLSGMITAWEAFNSCDGDIGYFLDFNSADQSSHLVRFTIQDIQEKLGTLKSIEQQLRLLKGLSCDSADALKLRLTLESNEAALQSNKVALQRIEVAQKSYDVTQKSHKMALGSQEMAHKNHQVAEQNIEVARQNIFTAELTASINCSIALAAVYFSLPEAVLPFPRNSKSLVASIFVFTIVLRFSFAILGILLRPSLWRKKTTGWIELVSTFRLRLPRNILGGRTVKTNNSGIELKTRETDITLVA